MFKQFTDVIVCCHHFKQNHINDLKKCIFSVLSPISNFFKWQCVVMKFEKDGKFLCIDGLKSVFVNISSDLNIPSSSKSTRTLVTYKIHEVCRLQ